MSDKEYIKDLERENQNLKEEIELLQDDLDSRDEREKEAFNEGYDKALQIAKEKIEDLM